LLEFVKFLYSTHPSKCPHKFPIHLKEVLLVKEQFHYLIQLPNDVSTPFLTSLLIIGESPPFYTLPFTLSIFFSSFFSAQLQSSRFPENLPTHYLYNE
jgi:hypothetical protein